MKLLFYNSFSYYLIRILTFPFLWMPYSLIHKIGRFLGTLAYIFSPQKRKKGTYNNLALAQELHLSEKEIKKIAKQSYQNLIINGLEYFRLKRSKNKIHHFVQGHNLKPLYDLLSQGIGVICVTGHISNWELCFLDHTQKCAGSAIGKQIKNPKLYNFILSIRQMHGGKIVEMKNAISTAVRELKKGAFFSMVNDQAYTSSSYSYPFFGKTAWTSAAPALIAYKASVPLISVTTKRLPKGRYEYTLSDPIWPDNTKPLKAEVQRMMNLVMKDFERAVSKDPGQWLWQHRRWKQEGYNSIWEEYKGDSILFVLPKDKECFDWINKDLWLIRQIYPRHFLTYLIPKEFEKEFSLTDEEVLTYDSPSGLLIRDYRFQLIFDFTNFTRLKKHFLKLGAYKYFDLNHFELKMKEKGLPDLKLFSFDHTFRSVVCLSEAIIKHPKAHTTSA